MERLPSLAPIIVAPPIAVIVHSCIKQHLRFTVERDLNGHQAMAVSPGSCSLPPLVLGNSADSETFRLDPVSGLGLVGKQAKCVWPLCVLNPTFCALMQLPKGRHDRGERGRGKGIGVSAWAAPLIALAAGPVQD